jgi:hypothetical protein
MAADIVKPLGGWALYGLPSPEPPPAVDVLLLIEAWNSLIYCRNMVWFPLYKARTFTPRFSKSTPLFTALRIDQTFN